MRAQDCYASLQCVIRRGSVSSQVMFLFRGSAEMIVRLLLWFKAEDERREERSWGGNTRRPLLSLSASLLSHPPDSLPSSPPSRTHTHTCSSNNFDFVLGSSWLVQTSPNASEEPLGRVLIGWETMTLGGVGWYNIFFNFFFTFLQCLTFWWCRCLHPSYP